MVPAKSPLPTMIRACHGWLRRGAGTLCILPFVTVLRAASKNICTVGVEVLQPIHFVNIHFQPDCPNFLKDSLISLHDVCRLCSTPQL